jgi:hypothetical protein
MSRLKHRLTRVEQRIGTPPTYFSYPPLPHPLTFEAFAKRFAEMQERAVQGDPQATWRVERIHLLFAGAKERQSNELTNANHET